MVLAVKIKPGQVSWPENARSVIVIAVEHPEERQELDWLKEGHSGGTIGNRILMSICDKVSEWVQEEKGIRTNKLPYHIEHGGIFLKDAARIGVYSRHQCNIQMELDIDNCKKTKVEGRDEPARLVRYCRLCELTCPIGKTGIGVTLST